jgi:hypothetical protein
MSYIDFNGQTLAIGRASYGGDSADVSGDLSNVTNIFSTVGAFAALRSDGSVVTWGGIEGLMAYNYWTADTSGNLIYIPEDGGESRVGVNVPQPSAFLDSSGTFYLGEHSSWDYSSLDFSGVDTYGRNTQLNNGDRRNVRKVITGERFTLVLYDSGTVRLFTTTALTNLGGLVGISGETDIADIFTHNYTVPIEAACIVAIYRNGSAKAWTFANNQQFITDLSNSSIHFRTFSIATTQQDASHNIICIGSGSSDTTSITAGFFRNTYEYTSTVLNILVNNHRQIEAGQNFIVRLGYDGRLIIHYVFDLFTNNRFTGISYESLDDIVKISCGKHHILALDKNGTAYAFANNTITDDRITGVGPLSVYAGIYSRTGVRDIYAGGDFSVLLLADNSLFACGSLNIPSGIFSRNLRVFAGNDTLFMKKQQTHNRITGATAIRDHVHIGNDGGMFCDTYPLTIYDETRPISGSVYLGGRGPRSYSEVILGDDSPYQEATQTLWTIEHKRGNVAEDHHLSIGFKDGGFDKSVITADTCGNIRIGYVEDISSYPHRLGVNGSQYIGGDLTIQGTTRFGSDFRFANNVLYVSGTQVGIMTSTPTPGTSLDVNGNERVTGNLQVIGDSTFNGQVSFSSGFNIGTFYAVSAVGVAIGKTTPQNARLDVIGDAIISTDLRASDAFFTNTTTTSRIGVGRSNPRFAVDVSGRAAITGNTEIGGIASIGKLITTTAALDVSGTSIVSGNMTVGKTTMASIDGIDVSGSGLFTGQVGIGKTTISNDIFLDVSGNTVINGNIGVNRNPTSNALDILGNTVVTGNSSVSGAIAIGKTNPSAQLDVVGSMIISDNTSIGGNLAIGKSSAARVLDVSGDSAISGILYVSDISSSRPLSQWTTSGSDIFYRTGAVGVGRSDPSSGVVLDVSGNTRVAGTLFVTDISSSQTLSQWTTTGSNIFYSTGSIGVGTSSPSTTLDVSGTARITGTTTICGTLFVRDISGFTGSQWTTNTSNIFYTTGNVGIGKTNPTVGLDVSGNTALSGDLIVDTNVLVVDSSNNRVGVGRTDPAFVLDVSGNTRVAGTLFVTDISSSQTLSQWTTTGSNISYRTGSVGVGTSSPSTTLDVSGTARITGTTTICGTLFVRDISGVSLGGSSQWTTSGSNISYSTGNVGIGTNSPATTLDVSGTVRVNQNRFTIDLSNSISISKTISAQVNATLTINNISAGYDGGWQEYFTNTNFTVPSDYRSTSVTIIVTYNKAMSNEWYGGMRIQTTDGTYRRGLWSYDDNSTGIKTRTFNFTNFFIPGKSYQFVYTRYSGIDMRDISIRVASNTTNVTDVSGSIGLYGNIHFNSEEVTLFNPSGHTNMTIYGRNQWIGETITYHHADTNGSMWTVGNTGNNPDLGLGSFNFNCDGANYMTMLKTGNIGLGTTTPRGLLDLGTSMSNRKLLLFSGSNNDHQFLGFGVNSNILRYQVAASADDHVFYSGSSSTASTELMRIRGNGTVGIRNAAPTTTLDVSGTARFTGNTTICGTLFVRDISGVSLGGGSSQWTTVGSNIVYNGGRVGIGLSTPYSVLDISGSAHFTQSATQIVGVNWNGIQTPQANQWKSVCWAPELRIYCAVASDGTSRVMTSSDGINWVTQTAAQQNSWNSIAWSGSLFCAVASDGTNRVMTSPNGVTWTTRNASEANGWNSVTWSSTLSLFCAVATGGTTNRAMTSPDGITWTARAIGANTFNWVVWAPGPNVFVAVSGSGTTSRVSTSPDGTTWTTRSSDVNNYWYSVTYSDTLNLFVAVSPNSTGSISPIMTCPGGSITAAGNNWTTRSVPETSSFTNVIWASGPRLFVACAQTGTSRIATSPDGVNWTMRTSSEQASYYGLAFSPYLNQIVSTNLDGVNRAMVSMNSLPYRFTNGTMSLGTTNVSSNVLEVSGNVAISGNMVVDTNVLVVDGSNNCVGVGRTDPSVALDVSGFFIGLPQVAIFQDQKTQNTGGGAASAGWVTRTLNTQVYNTITGASLNTGTSLFTLPAGTYRVEASTTGHGIKFIAAIQRSSDTLGTNLLLRGTSASAGIDSQVTTISLINGILTVPTSTTYRLIQNNTARAGSADSLGFPTNLGTETYSTITITLLSR